MPRTLRVQLDKDHLSDDAWALLRQLSCEAARFCNAVISDQWANAMGYAPTEQGSVFTREAGRLSADVRLMLNGEAFAAWKRHGKRILAGAQRGPLFGADRALVCRAGQMDRGRHRRNAWISRAGERYDLTLRLLGEKHGPRSTFRLWWKPQSDGYVSPILEGLASGDRRLLKVSLVFERPGRKVFALLAYESEIDVRPAGQRHATLGPLEKDGTLWLRMDGADGRPSNVNYTAKVHRLAHMKEHFAGIHKRLTRRMRRSGPGWRQEHRRALVKAGSFGEWAKGPLHQLSADVIQSCKKAGVGFLSIAPLTGHDLPMYSLITMLEYKATESGIQITQLDLADKPTERAAKRPVEKKKRGIAAQTKALAVLRDAL